MVVTQITTSVLSLIIGSLLGGLLLWLTGALFRLQDNRYGKAFIIALLTALVPVVLQFIVTLTGALEWLIGIGWLIAIIVAVLLIKDKYTIGVGKAILVWLVWAVLSLVLGGIIAAVSIAIFGAGLLALMGAGAAFA